MSETIDEMHQLIAPPLTLAALAYAAKQGRVLNPHLFGLCLNAGTPFVKEDLHDAVEAVKCHMGDIAFLTLRLSCGQAGIALAKEVFLAEDMAKEVEESGK